MARSVPSISLSSLLVSVMFMAVDATTFKLVNKCEYAIWPGVLANAGEPPLSTTGFALQKGESHSLTAPAGWAGRFWARTRCAQDPATGKLSCLTGDCGSGELECGGRGAAPPATLAEFKLDGDSGLDFFDVSLVDGYNLPMLVAPQGGSGGRGNCTSVGCTVDLDGACPSALRVAADSAGDGSGVAACKSACDAFQQPQYCCSGAYNSPQACKPTSYSEAFKSACPQAYSYAYDDETSTFTCAGANYVITFCPSPKTSQKSASSQDQTPGATTDAPLLNSTMVYEGVAEASGASPSARPHVSSTGAVVGLVGMAVSTWRLRHLFPA